MTPFPDCANKRKHNGMFARTSNNTNDRTKNRIAFASKNGVAPDRIWGIAMRERMMRLQEEKTHSPCLGARGEVQG
jgi:hypothetical protein